jgi:integrase/recombinase XerD
VTGMQRVVKIRGILGGTTEGAKTLHNRLIVNDCQPSFSGNHATFPPQSRDTIMVKYTYKFTLRKDHLLADGTYALVLQAFLGGIRVRIRLDLFVRESEWDDGKQVCRIPKDREKESRVNAIVAKYRGRVEEMFYEARMSGQALSPDTFQEELDNRPALDSLPTFIEKEIEKERADKEASTVKQYVSTLGHLKAFRPAATFADISFEFVQEFDRHLRRKGIGDNARAKYHTVLRKFILLAQKKRRRVRNPYEQFKVRSVAVERVWLTVEEVDGLVKLYKAGALGKQLQDTLRHFLFQIVTSVRVSDLHLLTRSDVEGDLLVFSPQKTKRQRKVVKIPLSLLAKELISQGGGKGEFLFEVPADATTNLRLKEIATAAGIDKRLTTHVGRHTFGFLYLLMGGKVEELREIMGHSKMETTQIYTHTDHDRKVAGVLRFDEIFSPG